MHSIYSYAVFLHEFSKQSSVLKLKTQSTSLKFCGFFFFFFLKAVWQSSISYFRLSIRPQKAFPPPFIFHKGTTPCHHSFHLLNILPKKKFHFKCTISSTLPPSFLGHRFIWKKFRGRKTWGTTFFPLFRCEETHFLLKLSLLCSLKAGDLSRYWDLN